jgi:hypothetical protein
MTDSTPDRPSEATAAAPRRHGGPFRLAAVVGIIAGIVFIVAAIFWSGFALGACAGGGGHHHGGGAGWHHNGMAHNGVVIEQTVPSPGLAGNESVLVS